MPLTKRLLIALTAVAAVCVLAAPSAHASTSQVTIMQDNNAVNQNPVQAFTKMKQMGVTMVKYAVYWSYYAPSPNATKAPGDATSPAIYAKTLNSLATIDQAAAKVGIKLGIMVTSPVPRWAETSTKGCTSKQVNQVHTCNPSAPDFTAFMTALGAFLGGSVPGVPAVRWWSVWNEPNYQPNLMPQLSGTTYSGPDQYRNLVDSAWKGLNASGHSTKTDTILFGEVAPRGISGGNKGLGASQNSVGYKPVAFFNALYCETAAGKRFTGKLASANGCGASAAAFKSANPALFNASGVADHPYSQGIEPNVKSGDCYIATAGLGNVFCPASKTHPADPYWTDLASISNLTNGLAKNLKAYGSTKKYPIWSTEYGFWTAPPGKTACKGSLQSDCSLSQANAAYYSNWAEYLSYKNSRIVSFDQYQLYDPTSGVWTDGLLTPKGVAKATFDAWELPLYLPTTTTKKAANLTVWGGARPAIYASQTVAGSKPAVAIQFKGKTGGWKTLKTIKINVKSPSGYFSTPVKFTASGSVRLSYTIGATSLTSRVQAITVG
jgi:hypothetical protein